MVTKRRTMRWAEHVELIEHIVSKILVEKLLKEEPTSREWE
jgi:hypothetical protein